MVTHRTGMISRRGWMLAVGTVVVLVAATVVALVVRSASDSGSDSPGVTSTEILLGSHQPLTGPAAPGYKEVSAAMNAFFKYINAHGGVYGRSIDFDYQDDAYDPVRTLQVTQKLVSQDKVFAMVGGLGTATHQSVVGYLNSNGVPDLFVESGCTCFNDPANYPYTYGFFPDYKIEGKILGQYVDTRFPSSKVAYLLQDDDLGQNSGEGLNQVLPNTRVVTQQSYDATQLGNGLDRQVAAAKAADAQVLVVFGIPAATALTLLSAVRQDYHPTIVVSNVGSDPSTVGALISQYSRGAANKSLENGVITDSYMTTPDQVQNPWIQLFRKAHDSYEANLPFDFNAVQGMTLAYGTYQALHAAGPDLTRQSLLNALTTKGSTFLGPNLAPYGFSTTDHAGMRGTQIGTVAEGQLLLSGPVYVTDDKDAPVTTYSGPRPGPPSTF
jgi:branched-chain amino acid transport system substrate-binding protein